ncbi:hypothetical protein JST97_31715 [bacterium]|nr:hypothetical protein [bacterium]
MSFDIRDLIQVRQMSLYFQHYRELPGVKRERAELGEAPYVAENWESFLRQYQELDDSPADYDPRPGHLLLPKDPTNGMKVQVHYQGDVNNGRISRLLLDCYGDGFNEEQFIVEGQKFHMLSIDPHEDERFDLEAIHWDRRYLLAGEAQRLVIGPKPRAE